jgi:hypothetical protein
MTSETDPLAAAEAVANASMAAAEGNAPADLEAADQAALTALTAQESELRAGEEKLRAKMQSAAAVREALKRQAAKTTAPRKPLAVVNLDEQAQAQAQAGNEGPGQKFFFGSIDRLKFADGTTFHIRSAHMTVFNPVVIENLKKASENKALKIFLED